MKKDKNEEFIEDAIKQFCDKIMDEAFLESILLEWASDLQKDHRKKLITLHQFIELPINIVLSINPYLKIIYSKKQIPLIAISKETEQPEFFIFKDNLCMDAFKIPDYILLETMSEEILESFYRFFTTTIHVKQLISEIPPDERNSDLPNKYIIN